MISRSPCKLNFRNCAAARPAAISASAVRFQARNVRSLANVNRGSGSLPVCSSRRSRRALKDSHRRANVARSPPPRRVQPLPVQSRRRSSSSQHPFQPGSRPPSDSPTFTPRTQRSDVHRGCRPGHSDQPGPPHRRHHTTPAPAPARTRPQRPADPGNARHIGPRLGYERTEGGARPRMRFWLGTRAVPRSLSRRLYRSCGARVRPALEHVG